jgi:hypothetical protein
MKNKRKTSCYLQVNLRKYHIIIPENACKRNVETRDKSRKGAKTTRNSRQFTCYPHA